ncbi:MAG: hypothetical protein Q8L88_14825 [Bacteroidota bacterium]|nr:hypothetical protein [Bacteroidota bacterium]
MKLFLVCFFLFSIHELVFSQIDADSVAKFNFRFTVTYNWNTDIPGIQNRDEHRLKGSNEFSVKDKDVTSLKGMIATFTLLSANDYKALHLRFGKMMTGYQYDVTAKETGIDGTVIGTVQTTIIERYTIYPFSVGAAFTTPKQDIQCFAEMVVALGNCDEDYTIAATNGGTSRFSNSFTGNALGYQCGIIISPKLSSAIAAHFEGGYRGLRFYEFENSKTKQVNSLELTLSCAFLNLGLSFIL